MNKRNSFARPKVANERIYYPCVLRVKDRQVNGASSLIQSMVVGMMIMTLVKGNFTLSR